MKKDLSIFEENNIKDKIHIIRGLHVMLDEDLARLYGVEKRILNQAVKRNIERFPYEFMFRLSRNDLQNLKSQIVISSWGGKRYLPFAFTEQGVAMLSGILKSETAVRVSIQIMNAFVAMRRFIAANAQVFQRLDNVERKQLEFQIITDKNFEKVFNAIESKNILPDKGIFFDGQVFDAYKFISDIIKSAKKSIVLIDNYVNESILILFSKRNTDVEVIIFTKEISKQLSLDLQKYNAQYPPIEIREFKNSHDRFMIIDNKEVYHFGASLKDLGKKWFAFSKFDKEVFNLMEKLELKR